jgi:NAD(P)-dependent dehydrogenase (short-subunit alcohol dehydrogenase family)
MTAWSPAQIPDQSGRIAIVTGASSGIGADAAEALAGRGAEVILAVRNHVRGEAIQARIAATHAGSRVTVSVVDMADLGSIRAFAERTLAALPRIDILLNNAGLGLQSKRAVTVDGFERQFTTNHLGPFALTGLLMPGLLQSSAPRVVAISSIAHRRATIDFADLQGETKYNAGKAYGQSKLADLMFALALDRRARAAGSKLVSVAAHPGIATIVARTANALVGLFGQDSARGALPGLYAATMPGVAGGQYWGPDGWLEIKGDPAPGRISPQANDRSAQDRLWEESERLTGVTYPALA